MDNTKNGKNLKRSKGNTDANTGFASGGVTCKHGALCFYLSLVLVNSGSIDELRLYPIDASIQTYCYDENRNMLGSFDTNGFGFKYEYDNVGRLMLIRDHEDNILRRYEYNYAH